MGVNKLVAKFCAVPTPFRDHLFGLNQLTRGLSFLQSARTGRECHKPGLLHARIYNSFRFRGFCFGPKWTQMVPIINKSINPKTHGAGHVQLPGGAGRLLHRSRFLLVLHRPQLIYRAHSGRDLNGSDWEYAEVQKTEVNELGSGGAVVRMRRVQVPEKRRQV